MTLQLNADVGKGDQYYVKVSALSSIGSSESSHLYTQDS